MAKIKPTTRMIELAKIARPASPDRFKVTPEDVAELATSMNSHGLINPVTLIESEKGFEIIAGDRRVMAARGLKWVEIEARVLTDPTTNVHAIRLSENVQRADLTPLEQAVALKRWRDEDAITQEKAAEALGKGLEWVKKREILLELPPELMDAVQEGTVSPSVAIELRRVENDDIRQFYVQQAIEHGATQRVAATWVANYLKDGATASVPSTEQAQEAYAQAHQPVLMSCHVCRQAYPLSEMQTVFMCNADATAVAGAYVREPGPVR